MPEYTYYNDVKAKAENLQEHTPKSGFDPVNRCTTDGNQWDTYWHYHLALSIRAFIHTFIIQVQSRIYRNTGRLRQVDPLWFNRDNMEEMALKQPISSANYYRKVQQPIPANIPSEVQEILDRYFDGHEEEGNWERLSQEGRYF